MVWKAWGPRGAPSFVRLPPEKAPRSGFPAAKRRGRMRARALGARFCSLSRQDKSGVSPRRAGARSEHTMSSDRGFLVAALAAAGQVASCTRPPGRGRGQFLPRQVNKRGPGCLHLPPGLPPRGFSRPPAERPPRGGRSHPPFWGPRGPRCPARVPKKRKGGSETGCQGGWVEGSDRQPRFGVLGGGTEATGTRRALRKRKAPRRARVGASTPSPVPPAAGSPHTQPGCGGGAGSALGVRGLVKGGGAPDAPQGCEDNPKFC